MTYNELTRRYFDHPARSGTLDGTIACAVHGLQYGYDGKLRHGETPGDLIPLQVVQRAGLLLGDGARPAGMPSDFLKRLVESVKRLTGGGPTTALPVLLIPSPARYHMRRWLEPFLPGVTVLSPAEIPPAVRVRSVGTIG